MAYLMTYFTTDETGDRESIWFSVSRDGLHWTDIGTKEPILQSKISTTGIRDPFILYDERQKKYFILATDGSAKAINYDWVKLANEGSRFLLIWESEDLLHWSEPRLVEVGVPEAGCVWAPEAFFCRENGKWFVFWASSVREAGEEKPKQRIYGAFTEDFRTFSPTFKYIEEKMDVIDTTMLWENGYYYRFTKEENERVIHMERSRELMASFEPVPCEFLANFYGLEGPQVYYLREQGKWCLIADQFMTGGGYVPMLIENLEQGELKLLSPEDYDLGKQKKRHGGVMEISEEQMEKLIAHYGVL